MKAFTREGKLIELRVGQPTMGMALTEVRLNDTDIFAVVGNPESADWFRCLGTRFVPQDELPVNAQQPDQEPVAWAESDEDGGIAWHKEICFSDDPQWLDYPMPLYAAHQVSRIAALEKAVPEGYALISIDALKAWGKYEEVKSACQYPVMKPSA